MIPACRTHFSLQEAFDLVFIADRTTSDDENEAHSENEDNVDDDPDYAPPIGEQPVEVIAVEDLIDNLRSRVREDEAISDNPETSSEMKDVAIVSVIIDEGDDLIQDESESPEFLQTIANSLPGLRVEVITEDLMQPTTREYSFTWRNRKPANYPPTDTAFKGAAFSAPPAKYPTTK